MFARIIAAGAVATAVAATAVAPTTVAATAEAVETAVSSDSNGSNNPSRSTTPYNPSSPPNPIGCCCPDLSPHHTSPVHALRQSHERVRASLSSRRSGADEESPAASLADLRSWSAAQLTGTQQKDASTAWNFRDFERSFREEPARAAFPQPTSLPPIPDNIEAGSFPSLEEVLSRVGRWENVVGVGGLFRRVGAHLRAVKRMVVR